ncbi:MAG: DUF2264 domain-containing protein [Lachnospiraceae bacterium]|nr:DUF2264 domain-containing protein [Lachnospiraceae bacterium]
MGYTPESIDQTISPFTGLTRDSWRAAGKYLLRGLFENLPDVSAPPILPRTETEITYPHLRDPEGAQAAQKKAEIFEGLTRTLFIASVLLADEPDLSIGGISLKEYYKLHILRACAQPDSDEYAGSYEDMQALTKDPDPFRPYQQTVETCALVIGLTMCEEVIWQDYTGEERDAIAAFLTGYAHANTVPQNWRLFNMLDMAFLHLHGYPIDENIMLDHAQAILAWYAGDGWYRDGHSFDYYSCWAFNFYAPLWNRWYGYAQMPAIAAAFEEHSNALMKSYASFFDRDGYVNMWGRSCIYRNAATSAFDGNLFLDRSILAEDPAACGWARRICSGALLQFLSRDDFLSAGAPSLGFYGQFLPLVQGYSCAESPFWLGKAFLCLHLPAGHPFWTIPEREGIWETLPENGVKETVLEGPALVFTNHRANGETILRTGRVVKAKGDIHGMWNYGKLSFNSKYPWESTPRNASSTDDGAVESQQYVLKNLLNGETERANVTFYAGVRDGVLYRRQFFDYCLEKEGHWLQAINLADCPMPFGILRADRLRLFRRPTQITLGAYGFPDNGTEIRRIAKDGARAIVLKGQNACGHPRCLAMTVWDGWQELACMESRGTSPDSDRSIVIYAKGALMRQYDASEPYLFLSQVITRDDGGDFSEADLFPIRQIDYTDAGRTGAYGPVRITLQNGDARVIYFDGIEGRLSL